MFEACVQSLVALRRAASRHDIDQKIKTVLKNVDTLLNITDFDGQMGLVSKNKKIAWSDLIAKKNEVCTDETSKACQLARRLIMFAIRGTLTVDNSIIVPGRIGSHIHVC